MIHSNSLSEVRVAVLRSLQDKDCSEHNLVTLYQQYADLLFQQQGPKERMDWKEYLQSTTSSTSSGDVVTTTTPSPSFQHQLCQRVQAIVDPDECWIVEEMDKMVDLWDPCCSQLMQIRNEKGNPFVQATNRTSSSSSGAYRRPSKESMLFKSECVDADQRPMCCEFFVSSSSYLRLPVLHELAVRIRVPINIFNTNDDTSSYDSTTLDFEQDGFLRLFDPAAVLWPTAYLLGQCIASPILCGIMSELWEAAFIGHGYALEIGAGIGFPSVVLARTLKSIHGDETSRSRVVATDKAPHAIALTIANARAANTSVTGRVLDHYNEHELVALRSTYPSGFSIILGSSLMSMFDETTKFKDHHLWKTLDLLLDKSDKAIVLLAHTIHSLQVPTNGMFHRKAVISGDLFGMKTRWGESSDFEISVFHRFATDESLDQDL